MAEYSENTGKENSNGKKSDSNKPSNREQEKDYFGESPAKLDNLLSETGKKDNQGQKNDYFGEKPEKLDQILSTSNKKNKTNKTNKEKPTNRKLDEFTNKQQDFRSLKKPGMESKIPPSFGGKKPEKFYPNPPRITDMYTADGRKVKVEILPDGTVQRVQYNNLSFTGNEEKGQKIASSNQKSNSKPSSNKLLGKNAPNYKLNKNPTINNETNRKNELTPKNSSPQQNSFSATSTNKIFGKDAPTYRLNKNPITQNESNPKNEPNPNIDYLKIPIVEDTDILGKILKNPPENITDKANETNETGRMYYMKNEVTQKRYIGQTIKTVNERLSKHFTEAKSKDDNTRINNSIRKHGRDKFTINEFQTIYNQKQWVLDKMETHYIKKYKTRDPRYGYNIAAGGKGGKHSPETLEKIKQSNIKAKAHLKGVPLSEEHRQKISKGLINHVHSEETKQKIAQSHRGKTLSEETKEKLSRINTGEKNPFFGKKHSESTINKMRDGKMGDKNPFHGKHHTEETKKKISKIHKDKPNTPEQKRKISETKIKNFKESNPINEVDFKKAVANGESTREIAKEFKLRRSAVHTWLGHLFGTSKITEAREEARNQR